MWYDFAENLHDADVREFAELLRYELGMDNLKVETVVDSIKYMQKRGFRIKKVR